MADPGLWWKLIEMFGLVPWIVRHRPIRALRAIPKRFPLLYRVRSGPTLILVPERRDVDSEVHIAKTDQEASTLVGEMFTSLGYRERHSWEIRGVGDPLTAEDRRKNLVVLCGLNPMCRELLSGQPRLLTDVHYVHSPQRLDRAFSWENTIYKSELDKDFALVAIKRNPYNPKRVVVMLFGLRSIGTLAAAKFYSSPEYKKERKKIAELHGTPDGSLEVVLMVRHNAERNRITEIRVATPEDGKPLRLHLLTSARGISHALTEIYESLARRPRPIKMHEYVYGLKYDASFNIGFFQEFVWAAGSSDVVVQSRHFGCDVDAHGWEAINFQATVMEGVGDIIYVPAIDRPELKAFLLFPIPVISKGEPARKYRIEALWPKGGRKLATVGQPDRATVKIPDVEESIDKVIFRIIFAIPNAEFKIDLTSPLGVEKFGGLGLNRPFEKVFESVSSAGVYTAEITRVI